MGDSLIASFIANIISKAWEDYFLPLAANNEDVVNAFDELKEQFANFSSLYQVLVDPNYDLIFIFKIYSKIFSMTLRRPPKNSALFAENMQEIINELFKLLKTKKTIESGGPKDKIQSLNKLKDSFCQQIGRHKGNISDEFIEKIINEINNTLIEEINEINEKKMSGTGPKKRKKKSKKKSKKKYKQKSKQKSKKHNFF